MIIWTTCTLFTQRFSSSSTHNTQIQCRIYTLNTLVVISSETAEECKLTLSTHLKKKKKNNASNICYTTSILNMMTCMNCTSGVYMYLCCLA